jgi:short-subunit dehydrogenase
MPDTPAPRRCLVTGASSGIGRALALRLAAGGARLVLTGRDAGRLAATRDAIRGAHPAARIHPVLVPADLTREDDRSRLLAATRDALDGALDLLVNAAGVGAYGRFESHDAGVLRRVMELNLFALAEVSRAALPLLRRGTRPAVVNLGSVVARRGLPGRSEYSASKFAVAGLTEAIRAEWAIDGIHVLLVNPGFTATAFEDNLVVDTAYYKTRERRMMSPDAVAAATLRAVDRRRKEVTLTPQGRLLLGTNRLLPRFVDWGLARWTRRLYAAHREAGSPPEGRSA